MNDDDEAGEEEVLQGGVANAGAVVRQGDHVLRPSNPHTATIHAFLTRLRAHGFDGASLPVGVDDDGRERLKFITGDVPIPPYPPWARTDEALASVATLLRRFHDASSDIGVGALGCASWSDEMADSDGSDWPGRIVCHNDVCLENVVFRDGVAIGLLDFDFAARGRPLYDLAQFARMCVPVDDDTNARQLGWDGQDVCTRLRLVVESYGLPPPPAPDRAEFLAILGAGIARGGEFVRRKVEAGDPNFIKMWNEFGGMERFDRRRRWFAANADRIAAALVSATP